MPEFVHLHNHSTYSLLDGMSKIPLMVARAKELGMGALALTDHGAMYGTIKFYMECVNAGIKPIIGCEVYLAKRSHLDKTDEDKKPYHLLLLAKNDQGYKNLMKLVSIAHLSGFYYKPRIDLDLLAEYHEGLIATSACLAGPLSQHILDGDMESAERMAKKLYEIMGDESFYLEVQSHPNIPEQEQLNAGLVALSKKLGLPLVATNDNHYVLPEDAQAQDILLAIQTQTTILDDNRMSMLDSPDFYIKTPEEMALAFAAYPEAIENTLKIAEATSLEIELGHWHMPIFQVPDNKSAAEYLRELTYAGLATRYSEITPEIKKRVDYELEVIIKKQYETYFLIVADFVNWAKDHGIAVGPGRGSAAGSVVSYALLVTDVDPFFFALPFERFLNPLRPSAPDIDLDFADIRRDEVIAYVTEKYGGDRVAQIITFGNMEARAAVRDVGRALGMSYSGPDRIAKMIPPGWQGHAMTIEAALAQNPDLKHAYETEEETKRLLDIAQRLEGVTRHSSVHAAGVVIADQELSRYTPIQHETNGDKIVTQYDMYTVGEDGVGLLKMDFLGLRTLTIIEETVKFVKQNRGLDLLLDSFPLDDPEAYKLLGQGETTGIFQLESSGMRRYIKELKPSSIFDLQAMVALYRPGPMANIPEFIKRKHNPSLISFPHPKLEEILKESYGVLTFQDDVLLTAITLAGYDWLEADKFRKAMGKKIPSEMKKQEELFLSGCIKNGIGKVKARELFDLIAPFAGYGFNKAHAACYAMIAFRTAYLKAHYPAEFMTAVLTAESRANTGPVKNEKISQSVAETKRLGITVLPPDVNKSIEEFAIEDGDKIRFGLSAVKNVGGAAITSILVARESGSFQSFHDFMTRVDLSKVNKKTIECLIKAGAMDALGKRVSLLANYEELLKKAQRKAKDASSSQASLFGDFEEEETSSMPQFLDDGQRELSPREKLKYERELLGFYLTDHPLNQEVDMLKHLTSHRIQSLSDERVGRVVSVGGIIATVKKIYTKKDGSEMAFATLEDNAGLTVECVIFPKTYQVCKMFLTQDAVVVIEGKIDHKDEQVVLLVSNMRKIAN